LLILGTGAAAAQTPITPTKARLSIEGSKTNDARYPGILLPDGSHTDYGFDSCSVEPGLKLKLDVWFRGQSNPIDMTQSPNSQFSSDPNRGFLAPNVFYLDFTDGVTERKVTYRGSFTADGITVTDSFTVKMTLFNAPGFYNAGGSQRSLLREIDALAQAVSTRLTDAQVEAYLQKIRMFVSLWWSGKLVIPIQALGDRLVQLGAPPELLNQLSQLMLNMQNAGLINIWAGGDGFAQLSHRFKYPPWLPPPLILTGICGPITVNWFGLGR
jgi:hypothetical protein